MDEAGGRELLDDRARAAAQLRAVERRHHRRGQRPGLRRRLRAGDGLRRAHRRAVGALRPARGQARDHPRLRRHAAPAAARGREQGAGDEPRGRRHRRRGGLRLRPRQPRRCSTTSCSTPRCSGRAGSPARRRWRSARSRRSRARADLDEGIEAEKAAFARRLRQRGRQRGHRRLPGQAPADVARAVDSRVETLAGLVREARSVVALTGAGISVPSGIPDFRSPGTGLWENVDPMAVAHIDAWRADPERFWHFYGNRFQTLEGKQPNGAHRALVELERRGRLDAVVTQNIDMLHRRAGTRELVEVHGTHRVLVVPGLRRRATRWPRSASAWPTIPLSVPHCDCGEPLKPDVVLFGEWLPEDALERAYALAAGRRRAAVRRHLARGPPDRPAAGRHARQRRRRGRDHPGPDAVGRAGGRQARRRRRRRARGASSPRSR